MGNHQDTVLREDYTGKICQFISADLSAMVGDVIEKSGVNQSEYRLDDRLLSSNSSVFLRPPYSTGTTILIPVFISIEFRLVL